MPGITFNQYQEVMKPFIDLIEGIVKIIGYDKTEEENEVINSLINQVFISIIVMHLSEQNKGKKDINQDELNEKLKSENNEEILSSFTKGITKENFIKYLEESANIVMTNYYFKVKNRVTSEKTNQIQNLYQKIKEGIE